MTDHLLLEAKKKAIELIINSISSHIYNGLELLYSQSSKISKSETLKMFQLSLEKLPYLSEMTLKNDYKFLIKNGKCSEEDLKKNIEAIFICYAKFEMLNKGENDKIDIDKLNIPSNIDFLYECYLASARLVYEKPFLFSHKFKPDVIQQNKKTTMDLIASAITSVIENLAPYNTLLIDYVYTGTDKAKGKKSKSLKPENSSISISEGNELNDANINKLEKLDLDNPSFKTSIGDEINSIVSNTRKSFEDADLESMSLATLKDDQDIIPDTNINVDIDIDGDGDGDGDEKTLIDGINSKDDDLSLVNLDEDENEEEKTLIDDDLSLVDLDGDDNDDIKEEENNDDNLSLADLDSIITDNGSVKDGSKKETLNGDVKSLMLGGFNDNESYLRFCKFAAENDLASKISFIQ